MYEIFEELLKRYDVTAYRVGKETGIPASTFSDWKKGKSKPKNDKLQKIADYFGVTVDYLMTGKNDIEKKENPYEAKNETERRLLLLCRKAGDVPQEEKEAIIKNFEATMDIYLRAKGIKKE